MERPATSLSVIKSYLQPNVICMAPNVKIVRFQAGKIADAQTLRPFSSKSRYQAQIFYYRDRKRRSRRFEWSMTEQFFASRTLSKSREKTADARSLRKTRPSVASRCLRPFSSKSRNQAQFFYYRDRKRRSRRFEWSMTEQFFWSRVCSKSREKTADARCAKRRLQSAALAQFNLRTYLVCTLPILWVYKCLQSLQVSGKSVRLEYFNWQHHKAQSKFRHEIF